MMLYVRVLIQIGTGYCILDPPPPLLFEETGCVAVVLSSFWFGRGCIMGEPRLWSVCYVQFGLCLGRV